MSDNGLLLFSDMAGFPRKNEAFFPHLNFQIIGFDFWLHVYGSFHVINLAHSVELKNTDCK